jgi:ankyrin repeat protein
LSCQNLNPSVAPDALSLQDGWTPLHVASGNGHLEVVRLLLGHDAYKEAANKVGALQRIIQGGRALKEAFPHGSFPLALALISHT